MFPAADGAVQPFELEPFMSQPPSPAPLAAITSNARAALKKINNWWTAHGFAVVLYAYMACVGLLVAMLLQRYCG